MKRRAVLLWLVLFLLATTPSAAQQMITRHLSDFATPGGGGYPDDDINDQDAFLAAQVFFQANNGNGTLILDDGEYIVGRQQLFEQGTPLVGPNWNADRYPLGDPDYPFCFAMVAYQACFVLNGCSQFTIQGGPSTRVRYRDCLYYGTFLRDALTGEVSSAVGAPCRSCEQEGHASGLLHVAVGTMFRFNQCDSIKLRNVELHGNIDNAILGGNGTWDGMQTDHDGVMLWESSRCLLDNVRAHHFGRDGLSISSGYNNFVHSYMQAHPLLHVELIADSTLRFNNTVQNSSFEWNGRQGVSWTGCSGLHMINCDMNYTGAGRMQSLQGAGLDIEGGGGPMRVRHGSFDNCRFMHNWISGIHTDAPCWGQQHFQFSNCVVKAGPDANALWANSRGMKFTDCQIYGRVANLFEQAENVAPYDTSFNLLFLRTDFLEEDDQWCYVFVDTTQWNALCGGDATHKLDLVPPGGHTACVTFDSCGFYTNCYGKIRLAGRASVGDFALCVPCGAGTCPTIGPWTLPPGTELDARFIKAINCRFKNTGRKRCVTPPGNPYTTELIGGGLTTIVNFQMNVPDGVRDGGANDVYGTVFDASWAFPPGLPLDYYSDVYVTDTTYESFPPCQPFYHWPDSIERWSYCNPAGNLPAPPCGNYTLTKTASHDETYLDSTVTFTIAVCNNTVFATPVVLSEQLPPSFTVTGASIWSGVDTTQWSTEDTTLTLNNGQCAQFMITGYFTAFGEFTNTVALDTDTATAGAELSASATVSVVSACSANTVIPDGAYASDGFTYLTGTVNIQGDFLVDADVLFFDAQVFMEAGAQMVLQNGADVSSITSSFTACNGVMWKGMDANSGSMVFLYASKVADAETAVQAIDGAIVLIEGCDFQNNRVDVGVPPSLMYSNVSLFAQGTTFHAEGPLAAPYPGQSTTLGAQGYAAFDVHNMFLDLTGYDNVIHHKSNGVVASKSDVTVANCTIRNIQPDAAYTLVGNGAGINCYGPKGWYMLKQTGFGAGATAAASFKDCHWGIYTRYMNVYRAPLITCAQLLAC